MYMDVHGIYLVYLVYSFCLTYSGGKVDFIVIYDFLKLCVFVQFTKDLLQ
jgi:hypothetical protein